MIQVSPNLSNEQREAAECGLRPLRFAWGPLLALYSAFTFFMLGIDMALLHFGYRHYSLMTVLPVAFSGVATFLCVGMAFSARLRRDAWLPGLLAMAIGGVGTIIHLEIAFANLHGLALMPMLERLVFTPRPPLAPAALAGTGLLLVMIAIAERWPMPRIERLIRTWSVRWPFRLWIKLDA